MRGKIIWLASYPKSGNTWFRIFLTSLLNGSEAGLDINDLNHTPIASSREVFECHTGLESSDLTHEEIDLLRPDVYRIHSREAASTLYMKNHDAFTKTSGGEWLFPPEATKGVIYLVRNPLDVAVSFANHSSSSISRTVQRICDEKQAFCDGKTGLRNQLRQKLLSWSQHVESWLASPCDLCLLRYEDMKLNSLETFRKAVDFLELEKTDAEINQALESSTIDKIQQQEAENRFCEKPQRAQRFFRKGIVGDWRNHLTEAQVEQIIDTHRVTMQKLGYLDQNGVLTV